MIFLYILLFLAAFIVFLLTVNIHFIFIYREKATVTLRVLFFRFDAFQLYNQYAKKRKSKKPQDKGQQKTKQASSQTKKQTNDPLGFIEFLVRIIRIAHSAFIEHLAKTKIYLKELIVLIATEDAAKTALIQAPVVNAANMLMVLLQRYSRFRCDGKQIAIIPDFTSEESRFSLHLDVTVKPIHIIAVLIRFYFQLFEGKDVEYERNSIETSH